MRTRTKICCLASAEEARLAIAAGADALGFNGVLPPTSRAIPDELIAQIVAAVPPPVTTILLSSHRTADALADHIDRVRPAAVQILHPLDPAQSARLAELVSDVRRIQVVHVEGPEALDHIPRYAPHVHAFLLDSGRPNAPTPEYGGTGQVHDWAISADFVRRSPLPVFLAGGLASANVGDAIRQVRPFGVDLCTGVRTDGRLDPEKLAQFMRAVSQADARLAGS